jgi:hypothetical protein
MALCIVKEFLLNLVQSEHYGGVVCCEDLVLAMNCSDFNIIMTVHHDKLYNKCISLVLLYNELI